jgi:hypothetical protein
MTKNFNLLSVSADAKTRKGEKYGYLTGILYLAPSDQSGVINVCPHASAGCRAACLFSAGRGSFPNVIAARTARTVMFKNDREGFLAKIRADIRMLAGIAGARDLIPAVRLNGTSDISFVSMGIVAEFPAIQFYDYTKDKARFQRYLSGELPANYHLTFSRSEENGEVAKHFATIGGNVAVVFAGKTLPESYLGRRVINGDESDLRFLDGEGVIVGLTAKGKARKENSGFVVDMSKELA